MHWERARAAWREWDDAIRQGQRPSDILPLMSDERIIDLLMALPSERRVERDVLAAEAHNRLVRRRRALRQVLRDATDALERVVTASGAPAIATAAAARLRAREAELRQRADLLDDAQDDHP